LANILQDRYIARVGNTSKVGRRAPEVLRPPTCILWMPKKKLYKEFFVRVHVVQTPTLHTPNNAAAKLTLTMCSHPNFAWSETAVVTWSLAKRLLDVVPTTHNAETVEHIGNSWKRTSPTPPSLEPACLFVVNVFPLVVTLELCSTTSITKPPIQSYYYDRTSSWAMKILQKFPNCNLLGYGSM